MEKELASKIFMVENYANKNNMEEHIREYIKKLKAEYPNATITREFYKGKNILIRVTEVLHNKNINQNEKKIDKINDWYIRQREER